MMEWHDGKFNGESTLSFTSGTLLMLLHLELPVIL